ncbi:MAG: deoxyribonuclease IV [Nitrospiraceae bacterium]|nr:MAG: deoxyribonuclease IV [Nitrospiraceae bacterium]
MLQYSIMRRLGVHTSIAGGLHLSLERAHELRCTTMQIFSHNPRGWAVKEISGKDRELFHRLKKELDISPVYIHTSYLINMASQSKILRRKSINLLKEEMERADALGAEYVILHTGSAAHDDKKAARKRAVHALEAALKEGMWQAGLLLENTAGAKGDITSEVAELAEIQGKLGSLVAGVCIDTCHAFQAGYNIKKPEGTGQLAEEIEKYLGRDSVKLIHLNDSKADTGHHRDRHEHIGRGYIGTKGLKAFVRHEMFLNVPIILETPKKTDTDDIRNLKAVRKFF